MWNSMTSTSFIFTKLANTMKYGAGFLYNLVFTEWRHCVSQSEVWVMGCYITLFSPSDVTAFHRNVLYCKYYIVLYCIVLYCIVLYCIVLYCIVLYCIVLYCIVLHCIALHCIVLYCIVLHCIALHCIVLYCIVLYCIVLYCIVLYCIVLYCIVLYCIVLYCIVLYCMLLSYSYINVMCICRTHRSELNALFGQFG